MPACLPIPCWPKEQRPRERLVTLGAAALSDAELVALLLGTGARGQSALELARLVLRDCGGLDALGRQPAVRLGRLSGLGQAKAARLLAACELGRRRERRVFNERPVVRHPEDAARLASARLRDADRECFWAFFLDIRHRLLREECVSRGSLDQTPVHPRDVFRPALEHSAAALVVAHNHPSGDPSPSVEDVRLTARLAKAAKLLGLTLLDHVIVGDGDFFSFAAQGQIPPGGD